MIELPARSNWIATASALQEDFYAASNAIDGRMDTRWSTPPTDPQWLQIDLGRVATVCGLTLFWEAAFASEYNIEVSENGTNWTQVYEQKNGDGNSDDINFAPILARYIKINGTKRGTGWGYSIWDVDVKGPSEQVVVNALSQPGHEASKLVDGSLDTSWIAAQRCSSRTRS